MMPGSLYSKLAAVVLLLFTALALFMVVIVVYSTDMYRQEINQKLNLGLAANIVNEKLLIRNGKTDTEALEYIFHILMVINPSIELYLLDPGGTILEFSAAPGKVKRDRVSLQPVRDMLSGNIAIPVLGDDPRSASGQKVFSAAPIYQNGELEGYLYVILGGEDYESVVRKIQDSFILTMSSWMIAAAVVSAGGIGLLAFFLLTRRLRKLTAGVDAYFKKGEHLENIDLPRRKKSALRGDEIDTLSLTFRDMATRIEEQMAKLQKSDLLRRELVANVSHDLRTPLATLSAYIETMQLNELEWSENERRKYLEVAGKHCERLSSLVDDLFELASLDAEETKLKLETFNIAELIQDVVQNYELAARKKRVSLTSNIGQGPAHVIGDIGLVERVLENLIANALRHTPQGGDVAIVLKPSDEFMTVQVRDTGVGIPEEALPRIFDRFYKIEDMEGASESVTGLGLAIAKRIMDLHGSGIEVESELQAGTCFTFSFQTHAAS